MSDLADTSTAPRCPATGPRCAPTAERRRGIRWFLAIAFLGAWQPWFGVFLCGGSLGDPLTQLATAAFVPAIAACIVRRFVTGEGFADSGLRLRVTDHWPYCVAAVTIPWGMLIIAVGLATATGQWSPRELHTTGTAWAYLAAGPLICVAAAPIFWGEEYGWTAYLRDRLVPGRPVATTFLTGLIWGLWHWPLPWVGYFGGATTVTEAVWSMLWWLPLSILLEFIIGWLWSATGSVWPAAMLHAGSNLVAAMGMTQIFGDTVGVNATTALLCAGLVPFVAVIVLTGHTGGRATRGGRARL